MEECAKVDHAKLAKRLQPNPFANDCGHLPEELAQAFTAPIAQRTKEIIKNLKRVFIAVFAHPKPEIDSHGQILQHQQHADPLQDVTALLKNSFLGGRKAIEIFSDAPKLLASYPAARPVPVKIRDIARAALSYGDGFLVLNPYTPNTQYLGRTATAALAAEKQWLPPWEDPTLLAELDTQIKQQNSTGEDLPVHFLLAPDAHGICVLKVVFAKQTTRESAQKFLQQVLIAMQNNAYLQLFLDALEIRPEIA